VPVLVPVLVLVFVLVPVLVLVFVLVPVLVGPGVEGQKLTFIIGVVPKGNPVEGVL
jgi:hypothetical protein